MKRSISITLAVVLTAALLLSMASQADAHAVKTYFTGTDTYIRDTDPGVETFPGADRYNVRDNVFITEIRATDPRVSGDELATFNGNFQLVDPPVFVTGRMWGTFTLTNANGYWEGTYNGVRDSNGFSYFKYVGHGHGDYVGRQLRMKYERLDPDPSLPGDLSGYIIELGS